MRTTNQTEKMEHKPIPKRVPINGGRDILTVRGIPEDLHACWVNDYNVQRYLDAGYSYWTGNASVGDRKVDDNSGMTDSVVSKNVGNGVTAYLMVLPIEAYTEDMKTFHQNIDSQESILFRSQKQAEGRYGNIEVNHGGNK